MTAPAVDLMAAFYAAVQAVEDSKCAEIELEHRVNTDEHLGVEREEVLTITVRRSVKTMSFGGETEQA